MSETIEIHCTTGSIDEARKICRYLVQERLVASAQIVPWVESIYMWNNQLETTQESKIVLKTRLDKFEKIKEIIVQNCAYALPEIVYTVLDGGSQEYLKWVSENTPDFSTSSEN